MKQLFFLATLVNFVFGSTIDLSKALEPANSLIAGLGQVVVVVATIAIMFAGISYMIGSNSEKAKQKLVDIMIGGAVFLSAGVVAAVFG